jgi:hypothetical protein
MANNSLTIHTNRFFALVLKSPIQMGWLSIINSVTNISRLGTFKNKNKCMKDHDANKCVLSEAGIGTLCTLYCNIAVAFQWDRLIKKTNEKTQNLCF